MDHPTAAPRKELMNVALGKQRPDLVITNARLFNVWTGRVQEGMAVWVVKDRIAHVGKTGDMPAGPDLRVVDAQNRVLIPGFIDSHTHLAWLVTPGEYVRHVLPLGTTTIITETMEVYPVAGTAGVRDYMAALEKQPMGFYATLPAMAALSRGYLGLPMADADDLSGLDTMIGVGESYWQTVMQFPDTFVPLFEKALGTGSPIQGHAAGAKGKKLSAYAALGATSCHEAITAEQVLERLEKGFHVQIREGSIRSEIPAVARILDWGVDLSNVSLVSDGITPRDVMAKGHMNYIVQKAIDHGFRPEDAIRMATLNPARHFRLDHDIGSIAPGRIADMILIPELDCIVPETVIARGKIAAEHQVLKVVAKAHTFSPESLNTVKLPRDMDEADLAVPCPAPDGPVRVRVIEFITDLVTRECICDMAAAKGRVRAAPDTDLLKAVAVDRSRIPGKAGIGFVKGFGMKKGAVATSAGWDGAEIIAIGASDRDIALAVNTIRREKGGIVLVVDNEVRQALALPIFGVLSDCPLETAAKAMSEITEKIKDLGGFFDDPLLSLSTLTGAAIPYLGICNDGLVDFQTGEKQALFPDHGTP